MEQTLPSTTEQMTSPVEQPKKNINNTPLESIIKNEVEQGSLHQSGNNNDKEYLHTKRTRVTDSSALPLHFPITNVKNEESDDNNDLLDYDRFNKDYSINTTSNTTSSRANLVHKKRISSKRYHHSKITHHNTSSHQHHFNTPSSANVSLQEHINKYLNIINTNKNHTNTVCPYCNWIKKEIISFHSFYEVLFYAKHFYSSSLFTSKPKTTSNAVSNKETFNKVKNDFESFFMNINPLSSNDKDIAFDNALTICEECLERKLSESIVFLHETQLKKSNASSSTLSSSNPKVMNTHSIIESGTSPYVTVNKVYEFIKDFTQEMAKIQVNIEFIVKKLNDAVKNSNDQDMKENCHNLQGYSNNASIIIERLNNGNEVWKKELDEIFNKNNNNVGSSSNNSNNNNSSSNSFTNSLNNLLNSNALLKKIYEQLMQLNQINNNDSINLFNALSIGNNILNNALNNIGKIPQLNNNLTNMNLNSLMNGMHLPFQQDKDNNLLLNMLSQLKTGNNVNNNNNTTNNNNSNQSQNTSTQVGANNNNNNTGNKGNNTYDKSDTSKPTGNVGANGVNDLLNLLKTTSTSNNNNNTNNTNTTQQQQQNTTNTAANLNQNNLGLFTPQLLPGLLHPLLLNQLLQKQQQMLRNNNNNNNNNNSNNNSNSGNNNNNTNNALPFQHPFPFLPLTGLPFANNLFDPTFALLNNFMLNGNLNLPTQNNLINTLSTLINLNDLNLAAASNLNSPLNMNMNLNNITNSNPLLNLRNLQNITSSMQNVSSNQNVNFNKK